MLLGALVGTLIGLGCTVVLVAEEIPHRAEARSAADLLVDAWRRNRLGTWYVEGRFVRAVTGTDGGLDRLVRTAQRPPLRLDVQGSSAQRWDDDEFETCVAGPDGRQCATSTTGRTLLEVAEAEVGGLAKLVEGPDPPYSVTVAGGCFEMSRRDPHPAFDQYGDHSRLCFDTLTAALTSSDVDRGPAHDSFKASVVRAAVTDADLELPDSLPS